MMKGAVQNPNLGHEQGFSTQLFSSAHQKLNQTFITSEQLLDSKNRTALEQALDDRIATIPAQFKQSYYQYQNVNQRHYLIQINLLAQLLFLVYFFIDWLLIPDVTLQSGIGRVALVLTFMLINWLSFKYITNVLIHDLLLPVTSACAAGLWFWLLSQSNSPNVASYQYAAPIFVLLGCFAIHVRFSPSILATTLISLVIICGAIRINDVQHSVIFALVYSPMMFFSLYVCWNNTLNARRGFLRAMLNEWDRHMLSELAHTDGLTQLNNRRQFEFMADKKIRARRSFHSMCLLMFDVDFFKRINDNYGHDIGDEVLKKIADIARKEMRRGDILARFGGEEFVALLPESTLEDAMMIAGRLRKNIESHPVMINNTKIHFTISIGVSRLNPDAADLHALIKEADIALYRAKQNGRNQVESFYPLPT